MDIDGVLNQVNTLDTKKRQKIRIRFDKGGGMYAYDGRRVVYEDDMNQTSLKILRYLVNEFDLKIIISSTWRTIFALEELRIIFKYFDKDFPIFNIIDVTPEAPRRLSEPQGFRGNEINMWLEKNVPEGANYQYVIIDDGGDFHEEQKERFVRTCDFFGLTHIEAVIIRDLFGAKDGGNGKKGNSGIVAAGAYNLATLNSNFRKATEIYERYFEQGVDRGHYCAY